MSDGVFVGLRFPSPPSGPKDVRERQFLCAAAQRQADMGQDVTAPDGVEIVFLASPDGSYDA